jgi:acyl dehydratase
MMPDWLESKAGLQITPKTLTVTRQYQAEKLGAIGIDPGLYGRRCDPAFFIGLSIQAGAESGISAEGNVNMLTELVQHRPIPLDEALTLTGQIQWVRPVPRGRRIRTAVEITLPDGTPVLSVARESLKPNPELAGTRGAGEQVAPVITETGALQSLARYALTPEATAAYSSEGNAIHYNVEAARAGGFRAPIIGGGQGVHLITAALWENGIDQMDVSIYFRRPIFWDESVWVGVLPDESAAGLIKGEKVATEMQIHTLARCPVGTRR